MADKPSTKGAAASLQSFGKRISTNFKHVPVFFMVAGLTCLLFVSHLFSSFFPNHAFGVWMHRINGVLLGGCLLLSASVCIVPEKSAVICTTDKGITSQIKQGWSESG